MPTQIRRCAAFLLALSLFPLAALAQVGADQLDTLPDFKVDLILKADKQLNGSWINLAVDTKGRLLLGGQRGQAVTRVTLKDGQVEKQEDIKLPVSETMGLLCAFDSLYVNGAGKGPDGKVVYGLWRVVATSGGGQGDKRGVWGEGEGGGGGEGAGGV